MRSPTRMLMAGSRKLSLIIAVSVISLLYLTFLIINYKEEYRLLEESMANVKQSKDELAAQLQVTREHNTRLQKQVDEDAAKQRSINKDFNAFRSKAKNAQEKIQENAQKQIDGLKRSNELLKNEFDDLTQEHAKLVETNKMTLGECERENEEHSKAMQIMKDLKLEDQAKCTQELKDRSEIIDKTNSKLLALEAVNADLKASLAQLKEKNKNLQLNAASNPNSIHKESETPPQQNVSDKNFHAEDSQPTKGTLPITRAANTFNDGLQNNLEVPSLGFVRSEDFDHKNVLNPQIAKPAADPASLKDSAKSLANSPGLGRVIPKDQESLQIAHPWPKRHNSKDSGFKPVDGPRLVIPQPRFNGDVGFVKKPPIPNNKMGFIAEPKFNQDPETPRVPIIGVHNQQIAEPMIPEKSPQVGKKQKSASEQNLPPKVIQSPPRDGQLNVDGLQPQVDNPLKVVPFPNVIHQPQLQLNPPEENHNQEKEPGGDDDEDHAFGDDKDYGAGALDKQDAAENHGIVDHIGVGQPPPEWDARKLDRLNNAFRRRKLA